MSKLTKNSLSIAIILVVSVLLVTNAHAALTVPSVNNLGTGDIETSATNIISTILTLLGLIALVIVLLGGFKWMTSGGNEEKVGEAKKLLGAGVIGLIIVFAAWAIATFMIGNIGNAV